MYAFVTIAFLGEGSELSRTVCCVTSQFCLLAKVAEKMDHEPSRNLLMRSVSEVSVAIWLGGWSRMDALGCHGNSCRYFTCDS